MILSFIVTLDIYLRFIIVVNMLQLFYLIGQKVEQFSLQKN